MRHYYLGLNARRRGAVRQLITIGTPHDYLALERALSKKYGGTAVLAKNGRSALANALQRYLPRGSRVIVNGFTCYAVIEAVYAAGCVPVYADIDRETLNFDMKTLNDALAGPAVTSSPNVLADAARAGGPPPATSPASESIGAIIIQNTLGIPVEMAAIEEFAKRHGLLLIEDLAHSTGVKYPDGREAGTVGAATVLSFGKDKAIDTVSGGAVVYREESTTIPSRPTLPPLPSDYLRERLYPTLAAMVRGLTRVHLGGVLMRLLLRARLVEKSADNRLDQSRKMPNYEAKLALKQLRKAKGVQREFYLVHDRAACLRELKAAGYHFDGFWYERPVSPERYYNWVNFPERECPVATEVAAQIINFPTYYTKEDIHEAKQIIRRYLVAEETRATVGKRTAGQGRRNGK